MHCDKRSITELTCVLIVIFFMAAIGLWLSSCTALGIKAKASTWCDRVPEGSYSVLCVVGESIGATPEQMGAILKVANLAALDEAYTAEEANDFIARLQGNIKYAQLATGAGITYWQLIDYIAQEYGRLPKKVQMAFILMQDMIEMDNTISLPNAGVLSDYDWDGIEAHLAQQQGIVAAYLK